MQQDNMNINIVGVLLHDRVLLTGPVSLTVAFLHIVMRCCVQLQYRVCLVWTLTSKCLVSGEVSINILSRLDLSSGTRYGKLGPEQNQLALR